jgi:hypothetical protein
MKKLVFGLALLVSASVFAASPQDKCLQGNVCSQGSFYGMFISSATAYVAAGGAGTGVTIATPSNQSACITDLTFGLGTGQTMYLQDLTTATTFYTMTAALIGSSPAGFHRDHLGPLCLPGGDKFVIYISSGAASAGLVNYEGFYADYQNK